MVEFRFDIKGLFPQPIIKVSSNLLPHTFRGDRRHCLDATSKMSEIIDSLGQLSATSQGLSKPVTTAQRLRMSENQTIYLLADTEAGKNGQVTGLLKVGTKDLYLFDEKAVTRKVEQAPCILDFYVHESRQRMGLGKQLFQTMLKEENWVPVKCSVDRPSDKLLGFLSKHYGLVRSIPQANNFVLYEGFFGNPQPDGTQHRNSTSSNNNRASPQPNAGTNGLHITNSPNTQLFGATYLGEEANRRGRRSSGGQQQTSPNVLLQQITQISPSGRYGAPRPTCTMAEFMDPRRSGNARQGGAQASKTSVASRQAAQATSGGVPRKYGSEASLTPSQAKRDAENPRKSPLDALSRTTYRQEAMQKRSGLQDVDDAYMSANMFARPSRVRHSGLDSGMGAPPAGNVAGTSMPNLTQTPGMPAAVAPIRLAGGGGGEPIQMQYQQGQPQQPIGQPQQSPQQAAAPPISPQVTATQSQQQLPPQMVTQPPPQQTYVPPTARHDHRGQQQAGAAGYEQQQMESQTAYAQQQAQAQTQASPQVQQSQSSQMSPRKYQQQQQAQHQQMPPQQQQSTGGGYPSQQQTQNTGGGGSGGGAGGAPPPEAEMCTTCPNCQTTIYLIIHAGSSNSGKAGGGGVASTESSSGNDDIAEIAAQLQQMQPSSSNDVSPEVDPDPEPQPEPEPEEPEPEPEPEPEEESPVKTHTPTPPEVRTAESIIGDNRKPPAFQLSKQHTGMKNRSFGVGMAVMPSSKMEFNQVEREDFGVVKINRPLGNVVTSPAQDNTDAMSTVSSVGGLTDQGYYDLKFYHNKLW